jgi:hypothetical protein
MDEESKWHPWFRSAMAVGRRNGQWFEIKRYSPEDEMWRAHFQRMGWTPGAIRTGGNAYTMPCRWPGELPPGL